MNPRLKTFLIHTGLFLITLVTTTFAGAFLGPEAMATKITWHLFQTGLPYSLSFLFILTVHEFGHYFTAVYYRIKTSLPYYIPLPPQLLVGTMGAVIRIRDVIKSKQEHFDIGIAGPLAGFVAAIGVLLYAFTHLPPPEYIFTIHSEYAKYGLDYAKFVYTPEYLEHGMDMVVGKNLLFMFFEKYVADPTRMPNPHELMHYPLLFAGFLSVVFTGMNLLPVGQLDGGHVLYGLLGYERHRKIATVVFVLLLFFAGIGFVNLTNRNEWYWMIPTAIPFYFICLTALKQSRSITLIIALSLFVIQFLLLFPLPDFRGYPGWVLFLLAISRFVGVEHPPAMIEAPLTTGRKILGWIALLIFVLCFTPSLIGEA